MNSEENIPKGFTLGLALVDLIPVIFFGGSAVLIGMRVHSLLFWLGAGLCILAGCGKVLWKILLAAAKKDIRFFNTQMRYVMPLGFLLLIISLFQIQIDFTWQSFLQMPSVLFFLLGIMGMIAMTFLGMKKETTDVKANWIEQCINSVSQCAFFLGILFFHA